MSMLWRRRIRLCSIHKNFEKNKKSRKIDEQNTQIENTTAQQRRQDKRRIGSKKSKSMAIYCFYKHKTIFAYRAIIHSSVQFRCALLLLHFFLIYLCTFVWFFLWPELCFFSFIHSFRAMNFLTLLFLNSDNCFLVVFSLSLSLRFRCFIFLLCWLCAQRLLVLSCMCETFATTC